jgi:Protein of unknown function (DUF1579)
MLKAGKQSLVVFRGRQDQPQFVIRSALEPAVRPALSFTDAQQGEVVVKRIGFIACCVALAASQPAAAQDKPDAAPPPFVTRGMPGDGHKAMEPLAGDFEVKMSLYGALGTPDKPFTATLKAHREWVGDGRFLRDITSGDIPGGHYWRMGTLGYSTMDRRYEWVTQDALNANMMIYLGKTGSGPQFPASLSGAFTDQGVLGEKVAGKRVAQRTEIVIQDQDHHRIEIYFTPPRGKERLFDRKDYTRIN